MKLKLTALVVGDVELTKRQYLQHSTTVSTQTTTATATIIIIATTTTTVTKGQTSIINSTPTATTIAAGAINYSNKSKGI